MWYVRCHMDHNAWTSPTRLGQGSRLSQGQTLALVKLVIGYVWVVKGGHSGR